MNNQPNDQVLFESPKINHWKSWIVAIIASSIVLGVALILMRSLGLFPMPTTPNTVPSATAYAAALGLVGTVLSVAVTLIGVVIKYSIDDRNARQAAIDSYRAAIESKRNSKLAEEAEDRNRTEASIRAVNLLCENNKDTSKTQMGGALLALVNLYQYSLAVSLLSQLWRERKVSPYVADEVIRKTLLKGNEEEQNSAGVVLLENASKIFQGTYNIWPLKEWRVNLPGTCRMSLIMSASEWFKTEMRMDKQSLPAASITLYQALKDPDNAIKDIAWACLKPVCENLPAYTGVYAPGEELIVKEIKEKIDAIINDKPKYSFATEIKIEIENIYKSKETTEE